MIYALLVLGGFAIIGSALVMIGLCQTAARADAWLEEEHSVIMRCKHTHSTMSHETAPHWNKPHAVRVH